MAKFADDQKLISSVTESKLPEWQRKLFEKYRKELLVHSQGVIFQKIMGLFPHEHPDSQKHRILAYEPITESSFMKAANNVHSVFQNTSYKLICGEKTVEYLDKEKIDDRPIHDYLLSSWCKVALTEDANALMMVYPFEYIKRHPQVKQISFIFSENIKRLESDYVVFLSEEESDVTYALEEFKSGATKFYDPKVGTFNVDLKHVEENTFSPFVVPKYHRRVYVAIIKGEGVYRIEETDDDKRFLYEFYPFAEGMDFMPVTTVGGDQVGNHRVYKSFLNPFVYFGNLALLQHSQHIAVNLMFTFPRMDEIEQPCPNEMCSEGFIACDKQTDPRGKRECTTCGGTGSIVPQTPYKIYRRKIDPAAMEGNDKSMELDSVKFYSPDTAILDYSKKEWSDYLERAENAVYIQQKVKTGNVESEGSKKVDLEDKYTFNNRVGSVLYDKKRFAFQCLENYITPGNPVTVKIEAPKSLAIVTEEEAFEHLNGIMASNLPVYVKANIIETFMGKYISQTSPIRKFFEVLKAMDLLLFYTPNEIAMMKGAGVIPDEQYLIHVYAFPVLQQMMIEDKNVLNKDIPELKDAVLERVADFKKQTDDLKKKFMEEVNE